jgi:hypothetical protein
MERKIKRKRGAQKGNQNAFKHGFYSKVLGDTEKMDYRDAVNVEGIDQEIALLRLEIMKVIAGGSNKNLKLILKAADVLDKLVRTRYKITSVQRNSLKDAMGNVVKDILVPLGLGVGTTFLNKKVTG